MNKNETNNKSIMSCMAILYEMRDEMMTSIETCKNVVSMQKHLIADLKASEHSNEYEDFIKGLEQDLIDYDEKIKIQTNRIAAIASVISSYENESTRAQTDLIATMLLIGVGIGEMIEDNDKTKDAIENEKAN